MNKIAKVDHERMILFEEPCHCPESPRYNNKSAHSHRKVILHKFTHKIGPNQRFAATFLENTSPVKYVTLKNEPNQKSSSIIYNSALNAWAIFHNYTTTEESLKEYLRPPAMILCLKSNFGGLIFVSGWQFYYANGILQKYCTEEAFAIQLINLLLRRDLKLEDLVRVKHLIDL